MNPQTIIISLIDFTRNDPRKKYKSKGTLTLRGFSPPSGSVMRSDYHTYTGQEVPLPSYLLNIGCMLFAHVQHMYMDRPLSTMHTTSIPDRKGMTVWWREALYTVLLRLDQS